MKKSFMKNAILVIAIIASIFMSGLMLSEPVSANILRAISRFPKTSLFTQGALVAFEENLKQFLGGKMTLNISGPDVIPTNEQFQPLQAGVFDLLYTHPAYHIGATAAGASIDPDPVKRRETGIIQGFDKYKGQFDKGWDQVRQETAERQLQMGVIPAGTKLAQKPEDIADTHRGRQPALHLQRCKDPRTVYRTILRDVR